MRNSIAARCGNIDFAYAYIQPFLSHNGIDSMLASAIGGMTLLQLSRQPNARTVVHTYARIARHLSGTRSTLDGWMRKVQIPIRDIAESIVQGNGLLTEVAWEETLTELAYLYGTGRL